MPHHSHPHGFARADRVGEQIRRDLAMLIRDRVKDPRVGMISLLDVEVSKDFAHAKIWFDVMKPEHGIEAQEALNHAAGFLRRELGHLLKLRMTPALHFFYDDTQSRGNALSVLIAKAVASDRHEDDDNGADAGDADDAEGVVGS
ncbi:MAG: 30S ribosome-binding factor RbfA [Thiothrix sp.]|uniref:30S ribosome-binding factor RbfA n=1 Tax=Thiothrix sp. TaxID=1032 RepID=UPI00261F381E|nr:30S ribosome-binding factor RbfA [Thiothrix sp.]MDD5394519.1 30S ribosome-binding factor RbfA [Thiothrix sp.]